MSTRIVKYILIQLIVTAAFISGQTYKVEYNKLTAPLFDKDPVVICIIEEGSALFDTLSQYPEFTKKFTCYSSEALSGLKNSLNVKVLNPEDTKFHQAVRSKLSAGYVIDWKPSDESGGVFILEIYSTGTSSRIYTKKFLHSVNSNPFQDAKKLLIDSMETSYKLAFGELTIKANPEGARFKLMKGEELVLEWKGALKQSIMAGIYKVLSEADDYIPQETDIVIQEGAAELVNIKLEPQYSTFIKVVSADSKITNIKSVVSNEKVTILYDLAGKNQSEFDIELSLKKKKTGTSRALTRISGDLKKVKPGKNKTIQWEMLNELGTLLVDEYELKISAKNTSGIPWYYYAGGAAVLGGVTLLIGGGDGQPGSTIKAATPPGRP